MKKPTKAADSSASNKSSNTVVSAAPNGSVKIHHTQTVRQSMNYQSAEVSYGVEIMCKDSPSDIAKTINRAEEIVEERLITKVGDHHKLLKRLG